MQCVCVCVCCVVSPPLTVMKPLYRLRLQMRAAGKRLFLATNSHIEFSELLMTHAFGYVPPGPAANAPPHGHVPQHSKEWHDLFDLVMVHCGKPGNVCRVVNSCTASHCLPHQQNTTVTPGFFSDIASFRRLGTHNSSSSWAGAHAFTFLCNPVSRCALIR